MAEQDEYIRALIELHTGLDRLGPGDDDFSEFIIEQISGLPAAPRIADLGCGAGAGALILAERYRSRVKAVDFAPAFLDRLSARARDRGLDDFIEIIECDIGRLDWPPASIDLLWSEGAAYSITFEGALEAWRPLLVDGGVAVISEMNYFSAEVPHFHQWLVQNIYPGIKTEAANIVLINSLGFKVLCVHRLPSIAWDNYYGPLCKKIDGIKCSTDDPMRDVIADTLAEIEFFRQHEKHYGYSCYIMSAV